MCIRVVCVNCLLCVMFYVLISSLFYCTSLWLTLVLKCVLEINKTNMIDK